MKLFLSYRFTGEEPAELEQTLSVLKGALEHAGHAAYCSFWDWLRFREEHYSYRQILENSFRKIESSDALLAFVKSPEKSEGMLLEIGCALAKGKPLILAIKRGIPTVFIREMAQKVIEFDTMDDLAATLAQLPTQN